MVLVRSSLLLRDAVEAINVDVVIDGAGHAGGGGSAADVVSCHRELMIYQR